MQLSLSTLNVTPLVRTPFEEVDGQVSPNGRWLAYESDATGRREVYVRPFPNVDEGQWQISEGGGRQPLWTRGGRELVYFTPEGTLMSVDVDSAAPSWSGGSPQRLFSGKYVIGDIGTFTSYGVSNDGQRFLMIKEVATQSSVPPKVVVVQHWDEELKRLVRAK